MGVAERLWWMWREVSRVVATLLCTWLEIVKETETNINKMMSSCHTMGVVVMMVSHEQYALDVG